MVSTTKETEEYITVQFSDANRFRLKSRSHDTPLSAILCEKGNNTFSSSLTFYMKLHCKMLKNDDV